MIILPLLASLRNAFYSRCLIQVGFRSKTTSFYNGTSQMAQTLNSISVLLSTRVFHSMRQRPSLCLPSVLRRIVHHQRRLSSISASSAGPSPQTDPIKDNDPNDILSARNLPLYQYIRKTIRQKTLPEIYVSKETNARGMSLPLAKSGLLFRAKVYGQIQDEALNVIKF